MGSRTSGSSLLTGNAKLTEAEAATQQANIQGELGRQSARTQEVIPDPAALVALGRVEAGPPVS